VGVVGYKVCKTRDNEEEGKKDMMGFVRAALLNGRLESAVTLVLRA